MPTRRTAFFIVVGVFAAACLAAIFLLVRGDGGSKTRKASTDRGSATLAGSTEAEGKTPPHEAEGGFPPGYQGDGAFIGTVVTGGGPVPDALVGVWLDDAPWLPPLPPVVTRTDAKGRFRIEGARTDISATLFAFKSGYAVSSVEKAESRVETELTLEKGAALFIVTQRADGVPVGGAVVQIAAAELWPPREGVTDDRGELRIEGLVPGEYEVFARQGALNVSKEQPVTLEAQDSRTVELVLSTGERTVFRVVDEAEGAALAGATVAVLSIGAPLVKQVALTGAEGRAMFSLSPGGRYQAVVTAPGFMQGSTVQVTAGDTLSVLLKRGVILSGVVQDLSGRPIQGARLQVNQVLGDAHVDGQDTDGVMFNRSLMAAAAGGWPRLLTVDGASVIPGPLQVPLPLPKPREGDEVSAGSRAWEATDAEGRFLLNGVPPGRLTLTAEHDDYVMAQAIREMVVTTDTPVKNVLIRMDEGTRVSVRVVDSDNFPLADAEVFVFASDGRLLGDGISATDGYALFPGLPAAFRIEASLEGYVPTFVWHEGRLGEDVDIRIRLASADKVLQGRVRDKQGNSLGGVAVVARAKNRGQIQVLSAVSRPDGRFEISGAGAGYYNVAANAGEEGVAVATSVTHEDNITLVVRSDEVYTSAAGVLMPPAPETVSSGYDDGLGVDNLGTISGTGRGRERSSNPSEERVIFPTAISSESPPLLDPDVPDNLGVSSPGEGTASVGGTASEGSATPFGEAEELTVTGPPSGKGGLPISLSGRAGKVIVTRVAPGSRVHVAGLTQGSQILSVDGKQVKNPADAKRAIQGTIGTVVMLEVSENGEVFTVVVQREATR